MPGPITGFGFCRLSGFAQKVAFQHCREVEESSLEHLGDLLCKAALIVKSSALRSGQSTSWATLRCVLVTRPCGVTLYAPLHDQISLYIRPKREGLVPNRLKSPSLVEVLCALVSLPDP